MKKTFSTILALVLAFTMIVFSGTVFAEEAAGDLSAPIAWGDALLGEVNAVITIDPETQGWKINYTTDYGPAELVGTYSGRDGSLTLVNDNGLTNFGLNFEDVAAIAQPVVAGILEANGIVAPSYEAKVTWPDALLGDIDATMLVFPNDEEWQITYSTPYGDTLLYGWYDTDSAYMFMTFDSGATNFGLQFDDVKASAVPELQRIIEENGLTKVEREFNEAFCPHRFIDNICIICGAEDNSHCDHPEFLNGVCVECGAPCPHAHHTEDLICDDCGQYGYHTFVDGVCSCGKTTVFSVEKVDNHYIVDGEHVGTVETVAYDTYAYAIEAFNGDGERLPITKEANVYLPYGYDPSVQYDIYYLMHGGGGTNEEWLGFKIGNILEHCIEEGICQPMILVTPTFYSYPEGCPELEGDDLWLFTEYFGEELVNDLMPAIESKYSTFANGDVSPESFKESRAHRAFAGLSMGSVTTWISVMQQNSDYFGYLGTYSAGPSFDVKLAKEKAVEIAEALRESGNNIFYWFNGDGILDMAHDPHFAGYHKMIDVAEDLYVEGVNATYIDYVWGDHDFVAWTLDYFNSLKVFFQLDEAGENPELEALQAEGLLR